MMSLEESLNRGNSKVDKSSPNRVIYT